MTKPSRWLLIASYFLFTLLAYPLSYANTPLARQDVPDPLKPWIPWVLHGDKDRLCPFYHPQDEGAELERACLWPAQLQLQLQARRGVFTQQFLAYQQTWATLPGDEDFWPQEVKVNGKPAIVIEREGKPIVQLPVGNHTVSGIFLWDTLPETLTIPAATGLLALSINGSNIAFPQWDAEGKLWLHKKEQEEGAVERMELRTSRLLTDDIPFTVTTRFDLAIAGKNREITLNAALLPDFIPMALTSPLPLRLAPDGSLRVQARPGTWAITITARYPGPVDHLTLPKSTSTEEEIWLFEARNQLRLVTLEGVNTIDPQSVSLPNEWKNFPAYRVGRGETLLLKEKKRGDPHPVPDQLQLHRRLWLDFAGTGYTVQDQISGTLTRSWRLEMAKPAVLGRAAVDGLDQFITRTGPDHDPGIELRRGQMNLSADSRIEGVRSGFTVTGWKHDFQQVSGELYLPPGWRLWASSGIDKVHGEWLGQWTLLDFFLVLIIALGIGKLWGKPWGVLALVTLILTYQEAAAPRWLWLNILLATALLRVVHQGWPYRLIRGYSYASWLALILVTLSFVVQQARQAIYPILENPELALGKEYPAFSPPTLARVTRSPSPERARSELATAESRGEESERSGGRPLDLLAEKPVVAENKITESKRPSSGEVVQKVDPNAMIQTGPGLPQWQWSNSSYRADYLLQQSNRDIPHYQLQWSGPVEQAQTINLWLTSPAFNRLLTLLRIALLGILLLRLLNLPLPILPIRWPSMKGKGALPALLLLTFMPHIAEANYPSEEMLQELKEKLLPAPDCLPHCVELSRMALTATSDSLRLRLEAHAQTEVALPLPGSAQHWLPRAVWLNAQAARGLLRSEEGVLWLSLPKGTHQILLEGPLPNRDSLQLPLPLKPRYAEVTLSGWSIDGLSENGQLEANLQLTRSQKTSRTASPSENLPPLVRVERTLKLDLQWQVETRIVRLTPTGNPILLEIPLLPGEAITTANLRVENGKALVNMSPQASELQWSSTFKEQAELQLRASKQTAWFELWQLDASTQWHVDFSGIAAIQYQDATGRRLPQWRPWPDETVTITVKKPEGVAGPTLTIDRSLLLVKPGIRATDVSLTLTLRSSRGGQHEISMPAGAVLQNITLNGHAQPIRVEGEKIRLPLVPGSQEAVIVWRDREGIKNFFSTPKVNLGQASVNASTEIELPVNRWLLFTFGPSMGPAILFWGAVLIIIALSFGLGRLTITPLRAQHWLLLGLGFTQAPMLAVVIVAGWFFALGLRKQFSLQRSNALFNLTQIGLIILSIAALSSLFLAIYQGLLGSPEMQVAGNHSTSSNLRWFQDRSDAVLPQAGVISLPLIVYRGLMLAWALWAAFSLIHWLRWAWSCYSDGGYWRRLKLGK